MYEALQLWILESEERSEVADDHLCSVHVCIHEIPVDREQNTHHWLSQVEAIRWTHSGYVFCPSVP